MRKTSTLPNSGPDSTDYPYGSILDETDDQAGTPVIEATYSDFIQSLWRAVYRAEITPNGLPDNRTNGYQLLQALTSMFQPVGSIVLYADDNLPNGTWKWCNGQSLLYSDYPTLYGIIRHRFGGTGDYFNLPDLRDRVPVGFGSGTHPIIGATGGSETHTLTTDELPTHDHYNGMADDETGIFVYGPTTAAMPGLATKTIDGESLARTYQGRTSKVGSGTAHNNMQPYITMSYIIKVLPY